MAFSGDKKSWTEFRYLLHDPQMGDDISSPRIELQRGTERTVLLGQKVEIDASNTKDNQEIARVWWDVRGKTVIDSDTTDYSPIELLKILLPAEYTIGKVPVTLHVMDISGNQSDLEITITVKAAELELREASARDTKIVGEVVSGDEGVNVWFIRDRDGRQEILSRGAVSGEDGTFVINDLSPTGGVILRDKDTKKAKVEVLETGKPVLLDETITQFVGSATEEMGLNISLHNNRGKEVATISFVAPEQSSIELPKKVGLLEKQVSSSLIQLADALEDTVVWREGKNNGVELWDNKSEIILGILTAQGQFESLVSDVYLRTQASADDRRPIVFEIWQNKVLRAQFSIPAPETITIEEKVDG